MGLPAAISGAVSTQFRKVSCTSRREAAQAEQLAPFRAAVRNAVCQPAMKMLALVQANVHKMVWHAA